MAEDYLKFLTGQQGVQNPSDPLAFNPFSEGEMPVGPGVATPFAEELPFRFTQFAINPSTQATSGQAGRTAIARSPFTSGQGARELAGLRSELGALGQQTSPGDPPDINAFYKAENFDPNSPTGGETTTQTPDLRFNMPVTKMEIPRGLVLDGRSPIAMAYEWQKAKAGLTPSQLEKVGPMETVEAYDMKAILGDEYDQWFGGQQYQGSSNQATQQFFQNLSVLPTTIDPQLTTDRSLYNLSTRDFSGSKPGFGENAYRGYTREQMIEALQKGTYTEQVGTSGESDAPVYGTVQAPTDLAGLYGLDEQGNLLNPNSVMAGNLMIDPTGSAPGSYANFNWDNYNSTIQQDLQEKINSHDPFTRFVNQWGPTAVIAGMSYGLGSGLGAAFGAGTTAGSAGAGAAGAVGANTAADLAAAGMLSTAGAATGSAATVGGLAGAMGMTAGIGASTVNTLSTMVATYGASKAAEMAGLPMDNPLMIAAMAAAGGAYAGYTGAGATGVSQDTVDLMNPEQIKASAIKAAEMQGVPVEQLTGGVPLDQFAQDWATRMEGMGAATWGIPEAGSSGSELSLAQKEWVTKQGMQGIQGLAGSMEDPGVTREMLDPASQGAYDTAVQQYEDRVRAYERWNQLNSLYEQKLQDFQAKQTLYEKYQGLQGRQAGLLSDIQGNIASNPFYDPDVNLTGIQSMFV